MQQAADGEEERRGHTLFDGTEVPIHPVSSDGWTTRRNLETELSGWKKKQKKLKSRWSDLRVKAAPTSAGDRRGKHGPTDCPEDRKPAKPAPLVLWSFHPSRSQTAHTTQERAQRLHGVKGMQIAMRWGVGPGSGLLASEGLRLQAWMTGSLTRSAPAMLHARE